MSVSPQPIIKGRKELIDKVRILMPKVGFAYNSLQHMEQDLRNLVVEWRVDNKGNRVYDVFPKSTERPFKEKSMSDIENEVNLINQSFNDILKYISTINVDKKETKSKPLTHKETESKPLKEKIRSFFHL